MVKLLFFSSRNARGRMHVMCELISFILDGSDDALIFKAFCLI